MSDTGEGPEEKWADVGDLHMRYLDWGGDGPPVMALHGLASTAHWYDLVAPYLRQGFRVIAPDQRGHGQSTQAPSGYDWPTLASDVVGLMDHLSIPQASVFGHSWGGNVAINVASSSPERVGALVMIDGGIFGARLRSGISSWEDFQARAAPRDASGTRGEFLGRMRSQLAVCWGDEVERIVQTMVYEDDDGRMQDILRPEHHAQVLRAMWDHPASETWPNIACPTLIVPAGPLPERAGSPFALMKLEGVEAASQAIKDCKVKWIPETIHDVGWHKPDQLADAVIEFLVEV